jgi:hypothetical protein
MPTPVNGVMGYADMVVCLNAIYLDLVQLREELLSLRSDFIKHDHGNTGSYAQGAITKRGTAATVTGSLESTGIIVPIHSDTPMPMS